MIVSAIVAGAVAVGKDVGGKAVKDAYAGLKTLITRKFKEDPDMEKTLKAVETSPKDKDKRAELGKQLKNLKAEDDAEILKLAGVLLELLEQHGVKVVSGNRAVLRGSGAIAQGPGAVAVGRGGTAQIGGIRAKTIHAKNVVDGVQIVGGDASAAESLVKLAKAIERGGIHANSIEAKHLVSGLQYIFDPKNTTPDELKNEVSKLNKDIEDVIQEGEIADEGNVKYLRKSLDEAKEELNASKPEGTMIVRSLKNVTEILNKTAETLEAGGKVQARAIKLAPTAAIIYSIAQMLFGV